MQQKQIHKFWYFIQWLAVVFAGVLIIAAIIFPVFAYSGPGFSGMMLRSYRTNAILYSEQNDDRLPLRDSWFLGRGFPFERALEVSNQRKVIPEASNMMNTFMSGRKVSTQEDSEYIPLFFVGKAGNGVAGSSEHLYEFEKKVWIVALDGTLMLGPKNEAFKLKWVPTLPAPFAKGSKLGKSKRNVYPGAKAQKQ